MVQEENIKLKKGRDNTEIRRVLQRSDGVKYLIIPKPSNIKANDYVRITRVEIN